VVTFLAKARDTLTNVYFVVIFLIIATLVGVTIADLFFDKPLTSNLPSEFIGVAASAGVTVFIIERALRAAERRRIKPLQESFRTTAKQNAEMAALHIGGALGVRLKDSAQQVFDELSLLLPRYQNEYLTDRIDWFRCQALIGDLEVNVNPIVIASRHAYPFLATRIDLLRTVTEIEIHFAEFCRSVRDLQTGPFATMSAFPDETRVAMVSPILRKLTLALLEFLQRLGPQ